MRLLSYEHNGDTGVGIRTDAGVAPTGHDDMVALIASGAEPTATGDPFEPTRILAPLRPGKILCVGINYKSHGAEASSSLPQEPYFFAKLPNAVCGPGDQILIPSPDTLTDWEVEFAFVIGKRAKNVRAPDAMEHIFGYTLLHDVSARNIQFDWSKRTQDSQIILGKNPDTFSPIGPEIVDEGRPHRPLQRAACHLRQRRAEAGRHHGRLAVPYPGAHRVPDSSDHARARRPDLNRHPGRLRMLPRPAPVPAARRRGDDRGRRYRSPHEPGRSRLVRASTCA